MLTRLRNAVGARHDTVEIPASRLKAEIAKILKAEGYITSFETSGTQLVVRLKYLGRSAALRGIDRVSRPPPRPRRRGPGEGLVREMERARSGFAATSEPRLIERSEAPAQAGAISR
ncbi:MAG: 30S ribosomal protein S8 [Chloroflexi bacterium RIFCSPLOWO2_02_FULL_71_16]|nr:MAG: 30S ribosomal protein S8 [Chloroflexi bacterium RIFCSPLOWO2_02_FULL_71_16]